MSHNQDLAKISRTRRKDQTSPEKLACNFSVIHFVVDMEHHSPDWAPHTQDLCRGRVFGLFNLLSTKKVSVILIVAVESTYIHCKEVCEYVLIHRITCIPKGS